MNTITKIGDCVFLVTSYPGDGGMGMNNRISNMRDNIFNKENPFTVPDGYFDHLEDRIMSGLPNDDRNKKRIIGLRHVWIAAASVLLLFAAIRFWPDLTAEQNMTESMIDDDTIYQWLYLTDKASLLAISVDADVEPLTEMDPQEIIRYLERDNDIISICSTLDDTQY